nr:helix-turn-helix domain-containing protein [Lacticaseibacillus saniviri]
MSEYQLSFEQYQILYDVANADKITLMDIVNRRGVTKPAIARQIKILRSYGFLRQEIDESDRRRHFLYLTPTVRKSKRSSLRAPRNNSHPGYTYWVMIRRNNCLPYSMKLVIRLSSQHRAMLSELDPTGTKKSLSRHTRLVCLLRLFWFDVCGA